MNPSRAKGTAWANKIVEFWHERGRPDVERRDTNGAFDRGDIAGIRGVCIEAKNEKTNTWASYVDEAEVEGRNADAKVAVAWVHRRGKASAADGYVVMTGRQFADLLEMAGL